jgi:dipeptidyl aminopeptidase/acylaminoacyl peptidase
MVYQLLKKVKWIKAAVSIAGPTDHVRMVRDNFRDDWAQHMINMHGGSEEEMIKRSAIYWADEMGNKPILLIHGNKDERVNVQDSIDLHAKLKNSQLKIFEGDDHSLTLNWKEAKQLSLNFFDKYV